MIRRLRKPRLSRIENLEHRLLLSADHVGRELTSGMDDGWFQTFKAPNTFQFAAAKAAEDFVGPRELNDEPAVDNAPSAWIVSLHDSAIVDLTVREVESNLRSSIHSGEHATRVVRGLGQPGLLLVETFETDESFSERLTLHEDINYFERDSLLVANSYQANDELFDEMDALQLIDAGSAWQDFVDSETPVGSTNVVVAVLDTGIDYTHRDLFLNVWLNQGEIPLAIRPSLVDVDGDDRISFYDLNTPQNSAHVEDLNSNGYIDAGDLLNDERWENGINEDDNEHFDDLVGWDYVDNDNEPFDEHAYGHGTHVAGIIGAVGNNQQDIAGLSWRSSLLSIRVLDSANRGSSSTAMVATNYATSLRRDHNVPVRVANSSFSGTDRSQGLLDAIEASAEADILFVAAAGNGDIVRQGTNIDVQPVYPAAFTVDNIITVASSDLSGTRLTSYSNFGDCTSVQPNVRSVCAVDIAAPGQNIVSTTLDNRTKTRNGTSMAAPHVTGVAALMFANQPEASASEVRESILSSADRHRAMDGRVATGLLNAAKALDALRETPSAQLLSADVFQSLNEPLELKVRYTAGSDSGGIDIESLDSSDLTISRQGFPDATLQVEFQEVCWEIDGDSCLPFPIPEFDAPTNSVIATYFVEPPSTFESLGLREDGWHAVDQGQYTIELATASVRNRIGTGNRPVTLLSDQQQYSFNLDIPSDNVLAVPSGSETLRNAISIANNRERETILMLPAGRYDLSAAANVQDTNLSGDLDITSFVTIIGAGQQHTIIDANGIDRVFDVHENATLRLVNVTLEGGGRAGVTTEGGGIRNSGNTIIQQSTVRRNSASSAGGGIWSDHRLELIEATVDSNSVTEFIGIGGGGIFNSGATLIDRSTISGNISEASRRAANGGGGFYQQGETSYARVINSTFSNNETDGNGGAIYQADGTIEITHATVTDNEASESFGGIGFTAEASVIVGNSIISQNRASNDTNIAPNFSLSGPNLFSDEVDPLLGPLQFNGGTTKTHLLLPNSPAIDAAAETSTLVLMDQRGFPRTSSSSDMPSLGAVEKYLVDIRGTLYNDTDGNGERRRDESALEEWIVYLDTNDNLVLDQGEPFATTRTDDPLTQQLDESEYTIAGIDPTLKNVTVRAVPRFGYADSTPIVLNPRSDEQEVTSGPEPFETIVIPSEGVTPVFHLDFTQSDTFRDISSAGIPLEVGRSVIAAGEGPKLENGKRLAAGEWIGTDDEGNQIRIPDHPTLDEVSRTAGSVVTWINVADENEWNSIFRVSEGLNFEVGLELDATGHEGVFGAVQGWETNNFGPRHATNGGEGGAETPSNRWTHIALTWNEDGDHTVFVNGVPGRTIEGVGVGRTFGENDFDGWTIGGNTDRPTDEVPDDFEDPNGRRLRGKLADFAIFNDALDAQSINDIIRNGVPTPAKKVFHLDFAAPNAAQLRDVSENQLPIRTGLLIQTIDDGGPQLANGLTLDSAKWLDYDHDESHIDILDHPVLDDVSTSAGSITTWVKVEDDNDWNNIVKTQCPGESDSCAEWSQVRGIELHTDRDLIGSAWGAVQGWAKQSYGPLREVRGPGVGTETPSNVWTHVALTWNDRGDHTTYVNGVPGQRVIGVGEEDFGLNETGDWSIGGDRANHQLGPAPCQSANAEQPEDNCRRLHGELADFAIFDGELTRDMINELIQFGVPKPLVPTFHLDFDASDSNSLQDVSGNALSIEVGDAVSTADAGGPLLPSGLQLDAGVWGSEDTDENQILILDHEKLDHVTQTDGAIATWVNVEDDTQWNSIVKTICPEHTEPCTEFGRQRGIEFQTNAAVGVFGGVQGYDADARGPDGSSAISGEWVHVGFSWDNAGNRTVFVNGVAGPTTRDLNNEQFGLNDTGDWSIGGDGHQPHIANDPNARRLTGSLADFAIYDQQLFERDFALIMEVGVGIANSAVQRGRVQAFAGFGTEPSLVGGRVVFEDHLGRVHQTNENTTTSPLVGLNTISTEAQPIADGRSISYDGEFVAFSGRTDASDDMDIHPSVFLVDQFGAVQEIVSPNSVVADSKEQMPFENRFLEVYDIDDGNVVFGARDADRTDENSGRILGVGQNNVGIYLATENGSVVSLFESDSSGQFKSFGDARIDGSRLVFQAQSDDGGFGIFELSQADSDVPVPLIDNTTTVPQANRNEALTAIGAFDISNDLLAFHGVSENGEGIFLRNSQSTFGGVGAIANTTTNIPDDIGTFQSFGQVSFDKGNLAFVGRGRTAEASAKLGLHQQVGVYAWLSGQLELVVDMQPENQPKEFNGRQPVELSIGPEAISGNEVVFYAAFDDGTDGIFTIQFESQSKHDISLTPGVDIDGIDFGRRALPGEIAGSVFEDKDGSGRFEINENGLSGWTVVLDEVDTNLVVVSENVASTVTGEAGEYRFSGLPSLSNYRVRVTPKADFAVSTTAVDLFLDAQAIEKDLDFAVRPGIINPEDATKGVISIDVFFDENENGIQDQGEPPVMDANVFLDIGKDGAFNPGIDTLKSVQDGKVEFDRLKLDSYDVYLRRADDEFTQVYPRGLQSTTQSIPEIGDGPTGMVAGYFDSDLLQDLVVTNYTDNTLSFVSNYLDPDSVSVSIPTEQLGGTGPVSVIANDFNLDRKLDVAVVNYESDSVSVLLGDGDGSFQPSGTYDVSETPQFADPLSIASMHYDGDAFPDLVVANSGSDTVAILRNTGDGRFVLHKTHEVGAKPLDLVIGDFVGDERSEIFVVTQSDDSAHVITTDGDMTTYERVGDFPSFATAADFNGDEKLDVAIGSLGSPLVTILFGSDNGFVRPFSQAPLATTPLAMEAADIDGDGDIDLIAGTAGSLESAISLLINDGTGLNFRTSTLGGAANFPDEVGGAWSVTTVSNANGGTDFVLANFETGNLTIINNRIVASSHTVTLDAEQFQSQVAFGVRSQLLPGDANRDGRVDFADFLVMADNFGRANSVGWQWEDGDFDGDGKVAFSDLLLLSDNFGESR